MQVSGQLHAAAALHPVPIERDADGPKFDLGAVEKWRICDPYRESNPVSQHIGWPRYWLSYLVSTFSSAFRVYGKSVLFLAYYLSNCIRSPAHRDKVRHIPNLRLSAPRSSPGCVLHIAVKVATVLCAVYLPILTCINF